MQLFTTLSTSFASPVPGGPQPIPNLSPDTDLKRRNSIVSWQFPGRIARHSERLRAASNQRLAYEHNNTVFDDSDHVTALTPHVAQRRRRSPGLAMSQVNWLPASIVPAHSEQRPAFRAVCHAGDDARVVGLGGTFGELSGSDTGVR